MSKTERTYTVKGMTFDHCRASVTEEVGRVTGVAGVEIDLPTGRLTVSGRDFSDAAVHDAVDEAGYELVSA